MSRRAGLALAAGVLAFAGVTTFVGAASGAPPDFLIADLVMGLTFVVSGLVAIWLRPHSPAGPVLLVSGALWFVGSYAPSRRPVVMHLGFAFEGYYDLLLAALLLMFSSRAPLPRARWLVVALAGAMAVRSFGRLVFQDPALLGCDTCPPNPFALMPSVAAFESTEAAASLAIAGLATTIGVVAVRRLIGGSPVWRRVRWPLLIGGGIAMAAASYDAFEYAWTTATHGPLLEIADPWSAILAWAMFG
ncbi:MAG TPA: hypothetical protein VJ813_12850, partial [Vicinamibacterales bacterium]|nr:hypothetical protein [Vicinamibacterales bacterium]